MSSREVPDDPAERRNFIPDDPTADPDFDPRKWTGTIMSGVIRTKVEICKHPWRHTVYGADDRSRNGTWCQICGEKI